MYYNDSIPKSFFGHGGNARFTIVVRPVNQRPTFSVMPTVIVNRDAYVKESISVPNFAYDISRGGPANENNQKITFSVTNLSDHSSLISVGNSTVARQIFSEGPHLDAHGTLTFKTSQYMYTETPALFTAVLRDDAGTEFGGEDTSDLQPFAIEVLFVNYAPSFDLLVHTITFNESSRHSEMVVTNISRGAEFSPEQRQTLSFMVVPVSTSPFFSIIHADIFVNGSLLFIV
jgi:hypothetical protein